MSLTFLINHTIFRLLCLPGRTELGISEEEAHRDEVTYLRHNSINSRDESRISIICSRIADAPSKGILFTFIHLNPLFVGVLNKKTIKNTNGSLTKIHHVYKVHTQFKLCHSTS